MTPRVAGSAGKGCFSGVHNRRTNLTPRHVTTAQNMSATSAMDPKEIEDRLAAAEALSSLGSIASVASAFQDSASIAEVTRALEAQPGKKTSKGESTRGRGGRGKRADECGTGRETKSRSARGRRGKGKVVQADNTASTAADATLTVPAHVESLPDETAHPAAKATTSKPSSSRGRGRPRGRGGGGGGGRQGTKSTAAVGQDEAGAGADSESWRRLSSATSLLSGSSSSGTVARADGGGTGVYVSATGSGYVALLQTPVSVAVARKNVQQATFVPSGPRFAIVDTNIVSSSSVFSSTVSLTSATLSSAATCSSLRTSSLTTPLMASTSTAVSTTPAVSLPSQCNLTSLRLDNLPSLSIGSAVLPNLPSIPNLPSLPSAVPALQLGKALMPESGPLAQDDGASSQLSPQNRDTEDKSLPLKKRKVIDSSSSSTSSVLSLSVPDTNPAESRLTLPTSSESAPGTEVVSPGPVLPIYLLPRVLPPAMCRQLMSEIETAITPDEDGDVPLHIAVVHENGAMVKKLIQLMAFAGQKVDRYNKQHQTPLHLAVKLASLPAMEMLLEAGADPNLVDSGGLTSTHMAILGRDIDCLEALLQWSKFPLDLNYRNFEGLAPLHSAVMNNDLEIVTRLLDQGADVNIMDGKSGRTVLFHAAETNQRAAVELLLNRGADPEIANYAGVVPALAAQGRSHTTVARLLARALEEGSEVAEKGGEEGGKEKEGPKATDSRRNSGDMEAAVLAESKGSPRPCAQELNRRLSASADAQITRQAAAKSEGHDQPPITMPAAPPILQSSSVTWSAVRHQMLKNCPSKKPANVASGPRCSLPGSIIRATHEMPGVVTKTTKGLSGVSAKSATVIRRNSVPVKTDPEAMVTPVSRSNTPPVHSGSTTLPLGLLQAVSGGGEDSHPVESLAPDSGKYVLHVKSEGSPQDAGKVRGQPSTPPGPTAVPQEDLRKLVMQNLLKVVAEKQNGGQARLVNWPALPGIMPLPLATSVAPEASQSAGVGGSQVAPVRGLNRIVPLPVPTSSVVTSPAISDIGQSPSSTTATPSAAHAQPTRPLLVFRSSSLDPSSGDGRRMGSVELRHVTTDALLALQHSSTNSVNPANQNLASLRFQQQAQELLVARPAGSTLPVKAEKAPPVANHIGRGALPSPTLGYASEVYSDEPKDLSLKSKKRADAETVTMLPSKREPGVTVKPEVAIVSKGSGTKKRKSEPSVHDQSKPSFRKAAKMDSSAAQADEKTALGNRVRVSPVTVLQGKASTEGYQTSSSMTLTEGPVISISESGVITPKMNLDASAPVVEINKGHVVASERASMTMSALEKRTQAQDKSNLCSEQVRVKPLASSPGDAIPNPRKKPSEGEASANPSQDVSFPAKKRLDSREGKAGRSQNESSRQSDLHRDESNVRHSSDTSNADPTTPGLHAKDPSLAIG